MPEVAKKYFAEKKIVIDRLNSIVLSISRIDAIALYDSKDTSCFSFSFNMSTLFEEYILLKITGKFKCSKIMKSIVHEYTHFLDYGIGQAANDFLFTCVNMPFIGKGASKIDLLTKDMGTLTLKCILSQLDLQFFKSKSEGMARMVQFKDTQVMTFSNTSFVKMNLTLERISKRDDFDFDQNVWYAMGFSANLILAYSMCSAKMTLTAGRITGGEGQIPEFSKKYAFFKIVGIEREQYQEASRKIAGMTLEKWVTECARALDHYGFAYNPFRIYVNVRPKICEAIEKREQDKKRK